MRRFHNANERGAMVLGAVLVLALLLSIASFAALSTSLSAQRRGKAFDEGAIRAQYAAEAGLVFAYQNLWTNPAYCGGTWTLDTDGAGPLGPTAVTIAVTTCGAGNTHTVSAKVTY